MNRFCLLSLLLLTALGCGGGSAAGRYRIEQDGAGFGEGAEKIEMDLRADKTFDVKAGPMTLFAGSWTEKEKVITLSQGNAQMGATYRQEATGKLTPVVNGKDVAFWRWTPKR